MSERKGSAIWEGTLKEGKGKMKLGKDGYEGPFSFQSRFESGEGTNPEELIGAAQAGCFSMALASNLSKAGHDPKKISTIELTSEAEVPGMEDAAFQEQAEKTKKTCPVSKALTGTEIKLNAKLKS